MITVPPARFPTDPEERIEPYILDVGIFDKWCPWWAPHCVHLYGQEAIPRIGPALGMEIREVEDRVREQQARGA